MVQFKQLRTTTPEKKKNEGPHLYIATNKYHRFKICTINIPATAGLITSYKITVNFFRKKEIAKKVRRGVTCAYF